MMGQGIDRHSDESNESEFINSWEEIQEVIESDFLISPGDIYPKMLMCHKKRYNNSNHCAKNSMKLSQKITKTSEKPS